MLTAFATPQPNVTASPRRIVMSSRKTKMISIRVSADEYRRLVDACQANNLPSVSDLARFAMRQVMDNTTVTPAAAHVALLKEVDALRERIAELTADLDALTQRVKSRNEPR